MKKINFFTDSSYIPMIKNKSIQSLWVLHQDWQFNIFYSKYPTDKPPKGIYNWFNNTFEFTGRRTEVDFKKIGFNNEASAEQKAVFLEKYLAKHDGGEWFLADKIYFEGSETPIDNTLPIYGISELTFETETERMISLLQDAFLVHAIDYYSKDGTILDIGCGDKFITNRVQNPNITTVDGWIKFKPDLIWDLNITPLPYEDNSFDTVLTLDLIEHLERDKGEQLLVELQRVAKKNIILLTPLFWTPNTENVENPDSPYYKNEYDLHRSQWTLEDFKDWTRLTDKKYYKDYFLGVWEKNG